MSLDVVGVHQHARYGFKFAQVQGTPADHASVWSFFDEQEVRDRHWHPGPGETVIDIGAAFGSYALPALAAGSRVIAFNPADFDMELLEYNLGLNPEMAERCKTVKLGLYDRPGWFDADKCVFKPDAETGWIAPDLRGMMGNRADDCAGYLAEGNPNHLRCVTLDDWMQEHPGVVSVDWMKLDVEGAEAAVLAGAVQTLGRFRPKLSIELHLFHDREMARKVMDVLRPFGYSVDGPYPYHSVAHALYEVK
jgi:FkbM family methyltransferase